MSGDPIDVSPADSWKILENVPGATLLDVRTEPEWLFVGLPDLDGIGKTLHRVCWQIYPSMDRNPLFLDQVRATGLLPQQTLLLICRSGVRSKAAALYLRENGFSAAFNVDGGFEGNLDDQKHRGIGGWKNAGLAWRQG